MRCCIILLFTFSLMGCGAEQELEDAANDETGQKSTDAFVEQCTDPVFPLVEKLNAIQNPVSGDVIVPEGLRTELVNVYTKCVTITANLISQTYSEYEVDLAGKSCMHNAKEHAVGLEEMKIQLGTLKAAALGTKEGRADAFGIGGMLHLPLSLVHGRVALNYETYCKLPSVFK